MNWEQIREEYETTTITLKALADKHGAKLGTLKSRKSREGWERDATEGKGATKVATNKIRDATPKNFKQEKGKRSGNPSPSNQFTKRNSAARKHGLRSKYFTASQREIMEDFEEFSIPDQLWVQIEIKFSAIIQLQKVMWVENSTDTLNEESMVSDGEGGSSTAFKVMYAYERYESYIKAQSRAMAEYRNLVKHFTEITHVEDERRLKLEQMQLNVEKTRVEVDRLTKGGAGPTVINVVDKWANEDE